MAADATSVALKGGNLSCKNQKEGPSEVPSWFPSFRHKTRISTYPPPFPPPRAPRKQTSSPRKRWSVPFHQWGRGFFFFFVGSSPHYFTHDAPYYDEQRGTGPKAAAGFRLFGELLLYMPEKKVLPVKKTSPCPTQPHFPQKFPEIEHDDDFTQLSIKPPS